jgi:hypothetical protein
MLIAESANAARRTAKIFPRVRAFELDAIVPGISCGDRCYQLSSSAHLRVPPRSKAVNRENLVSPKLRVLSGVANKFRGDLR